VLRILRRLLADARPGTPPGPEAERRQLEIAAGVLLHEARRADFAEGDREGAAAEQALADLFDLPPEQCAARLREARERAQQLRSFYPPVTIIKRHLALEERIRLVEHLWRVVFADRRLDHYEDHYVRKIAHLLYVPNTQCMLARNRARPPG
jgi:uncharacterized tellurite resistance protein B-like protein